MSTEPSRGISTPERPNKKFRNESSPFKGAALAKSTLVPVWEWSSNTDVWTPYDKMETEMLESNFCVQDIVILPGGEYRVDLRRFIQRNTQTGKERSVRRRLIDSASQIAPLLAPQFEGLTIYLNKLPGIADADNVKVLTFREILGSVDQIEAILLSSFGTDIEWLLSHFVQGKTAITLVDQPPRDSATGVMFPLGQLWPNFQVVHPTFHDTQGLFGVGSMHAKLMLIKYPNSLRVVVSSANLLQYDWEKITQNIWLVDIPEKKLFSKSVFGTDLQLFVSHLLSTHPLSCWHELLAFWEPLINAAVPDNVHLVSSVPGAHSGAQLGKFGHMKLRSVLEEVPSNKVIFQMSSIGMLAESTVSQFCHSLHSRQLRLVWPEYDSAMWMEGRDHLFLTERNAVKSLHNLLVPFEPLPSRTNVLNHSKVMLGDQNWAYAGSHNVSMAAWGKLGSNETCLQVASYELGILITAPFHISVPFIVGETPMKRPWVRESFLRIVRQSTGDSLWDFLAAANPKQDTIIVFASDEISIPENANMYIVNGHSDYATHLRAFFGCPSLPTIVVLKAGSDLETNTIVLETLVGKSSVDSWLAEHNLEHSETSDCSSNDIKALVSSSAVEYMVANDIALLCLDIDGTLVRDNTSSVLLPHAAEFLRSLHEQAAGGVKLALVTNQGGVGLRYWMEIARFGDPSTLPLQSEVEERIEKIRSQIEIICPTFELHVFMAFRYKSKNTGRWGPAKEDPRWNQDWRKPGPGMIRAAIKQSRVSPFSLGKVLMVGDMDVDEGAAKEAGVRFRKAPDFFT